MGRILVAVRIPAEQEEPVADVRPRRTRDPQVSQAREEGMGVVEAQRRARVESEAPRPRDRGAVREGPGGCGAAVAAVRAGGETDRVRPAVELERERKGKLETAAAARTARGPEDDDGLSAREQDGSRAEAA